METRNEKLKNLGEKILILRFHLHQLRAHFSMALERAQIERKKSFARFSFSARKLFVATSGDTHKQAGTWNERDGTTMTSGGCIVLNHRIALLCVLSLRWFGRASLRQRRALHLHKHT